MATSVKAQIGVLLSPSAARTVTSPSRGHFYGTRSDLNSLTRLIRSSVVGQSRRTKPIVCNTSHLGFRPSALNSRILIHFSSNLNPRKPEMPCRTAYDSAADNPNLLTGAMTAGPDAGDGYLDKRWSSNSAVSITYNAGLTGKSIHLSARRNSP
jgi:hypothetical protein